LIKDGELENQSLFIEDKEQQIHNLTLSPYNFTTEGVFNDRFVLVYTDNTLKVTDFETTGDTKC
jgi:hypothetical protein